MGRNLILSVFVSALVKVLIALPVLVYAQDRATAEVMSFIQQMTDKTKACAARGISEQDCVCQNKAEWQDMLVLMQLMQNDPNVDAANKAVLGQGTTKVQGMLGNCR